MRMFLGLWKRAARNNPCIIISVLLTTESYYKAIRQKSKRSLTLDLTAWWFTTLAHGKVLRSPFDFPPRLCHARFRNSRKSKKTTSLLFPVFKDSIKLKNPDFSRLFSQQRREKIAKSKSLLFREPKRREKNEKTGISTVFLFKKDGRKLKKQNLYFL